MRGWGHEQGEEVLPGGLAPTSIADDVRLAVRELDPTFPTQCTTMDAVVADSLSGARLAMLLLLAFGLAAASLAAVGIYGVISFTVTRRIGEMAIRSALGASQGKVLRLSMSQGISWRRQASGWAWQERSWDDG